MRRFTVFLSILALLLASIPFYGIRAEESAPTRDQLEAQLKDIEDQIADLQKQLATTKTQKQALATKIKQLQSEQAVLKLQIKSTTLVINSLDKKISQTQDSINAAVNRTDRLKIELSALLTDLNRGSENLLLTLSEDNGLAGLFTRYENVGRISGSIAALVDDLQTTKRKLDADKQRYNSQQSDAKELLSVKTLQQQSLISKLSEETDLLVQTKGQETAYQTSLADQQKRAAQIRNRIYELFETTKTVTFGQAVDIATSVEKMTGVRAAFLLGILTQESNLGKNVGTCNRAGDPPEKGWRVIMKPDRDQEPFKTITSELGLDIDTTPVSCPMKDSKGKQIGWGGAMGPAQFIPSTWMGYRAKVTALTGAPAANPWDIRDAFVAAGVKLRDGGATKGIDGEWRAAMIYFSGSTNVRYRFYGDNVAKLTEKYQQDINDLK